MINFKTAKRLDDIPEYVFSRLAKEVKKVEQKSGRKVLDLGIGSPDVTPSKRFTEKLADLVQQPGMHLYPGYGATDEFAQALIAWYKIRFDVVLQNSELFTLSGAKDGIAHLPSALLNEGDEVLVPDPGYPAFSAPASLVGAKVVNYNLLPEEDFKLNLDTLAAKVSEKTKCIWVNFPSNPTGQVTTLRELQAIVDFAKQHQLLILYDNAYAEITFDGFIAPSILQVEGAIDCAVELGSFSKSHSFAGYRMGWIVGNQSVISALAKVKSHMDSGLSLPLQGLGAFALTNPDDEWTAKMLDSYKQRRDIIAGHLKSLDLEFHIPQGSLYIWARIPEDSPDAEDYCLQLLREQQIFVAPGTAFGPNSKRYIRVSICANIDNIKDYF